MLAVGLLTDLYFALSAFEPVDNELDWSLVYPELATGVKGESKGGSCVRFARNVIQKIRCYVKDAKIDGELMSSLGNSIKNFESAAKVLLNS
jgi:gliding motility-associated protein GldL